MAVLVAVRFLPFRSVQVSDAKWLLRHVAAGATSSCIGLMDDIESLVCEALADFAKITDQAVRDSIIFEVLPQFHKPGELPLGKIAIYAFLSSGRGLKVGKVGANSDARYRSQHYNSSSAGSNLARSILKDPTKVGAVGNRRPKRR